MNEKPAIEISGLTAKYGDVTAVDNIDLTIHSGQTVALLGPNGAGKTTTVKHLLGVLSPASGAITVQGDRPREAIMAGHIAAMQQDGGLMEGVTVRELLTFVRKLYTKPMHIDDLIEAAGVGDILDKRADQLSGGQTQRVRFGLALAGDPGILVLDEPTAAMDVESRRAFWARMRGYASEGRTILFATHYLEEADAVADRVIVMARGRIVSDGSVTELKAGVGARTVRFTLAAGTTTAGLESLPAVQSLEQHGESAVLRTTDPEATLRALFAVRDRVPDLEVSGASLEEAFLALTSDDDNAAVPA
ncbi:MAG TPA: ABC transporter ATP-binding protein [Mycobacteriales bacterium]|nr:ABC transporter ATP-binding protein [Mycobacteriales bacterium]